MADEINYAALIDNAMHSIVREALRIAASQGLPGEHHFFISFLTNYPGVVISERIRRKYPEEMTIVLQYQYEKLSLGDDYFSVVLSFDNTKETVRIPFIALTAFADPSVKFGLQFRHLDEDMLEDDLLEPMPSQPSTPLMSHAVKDNVVALDAFRNRNQRKE
jgi:hypothetical protein